MKGYMYILECSDGSYYTGSTNNMELRLQQHQNGEGANHTRKRLPVKLLYTEEYDRIDTAFYREKQIQGWSRAKKEALMEGRFNDLHKEAECKNETHFQNGPSATLRPRAKTQAERSRSRNDRFQKYPAYKDSGVEWLEEVPEHWDLRRFKYLFKELNERSSDGTEDLLSVSQYTGVTRKGDKVEEGDLLTNASTLEGYKKVRKGDLVTNIMLAWNGSLGFSPFEGITSPAYSIYRLRGNNEERFFHYLLRTERYKAEFKRNSSGVIESRLRLYSDDFFRIISLLPPKQEQTAIASFLDKKCGKIDTAIEQKQKLIELLKERKQIIIQELVTGKKVWNKEKNAWTVPAEVKDSGVEWIGEIPEHWEVKKIKYSATLRSDKTISKYSILPYLGMENIESWTGNLIETDSETEGQANCFKIGDVLFGKLRPYLAKVLLAKNDGICSGEILAFNANEEVYNSYLHKVMLSYRFIDLIDSSTYGAKMPRANPTFIQLQLIPIPSMDEQKEIVQFIDDQIKKTDKTINYQSQQIEKLREYKSSLIDAAVTGKIKVS